MKVSLIAPPSFSRYEGPHAKGSANHIAKPMAHLGVVTLAAALEAHAVTPRVLDLDQLHCEYTHRFQHHQPEVDFCAFAAEQLAMLDCDVFGLGTMCSSYPLSIRIAHALKRARPSTMIVLGGPQASVVDVATLEAFPFIDLVIRGEADETLPRALSVLHNPDELKAIPGVTLRDEGRVIRNPNAPVIQDLDSLGMPAYHLYPGIEKSDCIPLELGRGCPFACTFCSTNDFFRRRFRLKSPKRMIEQMSLLEQKYGTNRFELVHDMFTVDRRKVVEFCQALLASGKRFRWSCSARTDCVDDDLLGLMAEAGCRGIFFGVETGSARMQRVIEKDLDLQQASRVVKKIHALGIPATVAMIDGFPQEEREDFKASVNFLAGCLRFRKIEIQLSLLAPLAQTPIYEQYRSRLTFDEVLSDISHQGWQQDAADRQLIASHPEIFPNFYGLPSSLGRTYLDEFNRFLLNGALHFRWLLAAVHRESGSLVAVFDRWLAWREVRENAATYYSTPRFGDDFKTFLRTVYLRDRALCRDSVAVQGLLSFEDAFIAATEDAIRAAGPDAGEECKLTLDCIPRAANGVVTLQLDIDVEEIINCLEAGRLPDPAVRRPTTLAARAAADGTYEFSKLPALSAEIINLCNGERSVHEIVHEFGRVRSGISGMSASEACMYALRALQQFRLVVFHSQLRAGELVVAERTPQSQGQVMAE